MDVLNVKKYHSSGPPLLTTSVRDPFRRPCEHGCCLQYILLGFRQHLLHERLLESLWIAVHVPVVCTCLNLVLPSAFALCCPLVGKHLLTGTN